MNDNKDSVSIHSSAFPTVINETEFLKKNNLHLLTENMKFLSPELLRFLKQAGKEEFDEELECNEEIALD